MTGNDLIWVSNERKENSKTFGWKIFFFKKVYLLFFIMSKFEFLMMSHYIASQTKSLRFDLGTG
jgi:hypothetical protein